MVQIILTFTCFVGIVQAQPDYSISDAINMIQSMNKTIEKLIHASQPVAFTACLSKADHLGDHQAVEYDHVVTNIGGGYDTRHSHFTAPASGFYQFSVTVMAYYNTAIHVHIVKNGIELLRVYSAGPDYESGSNQVNVHLQRGDMVWVQNTDIGNQLWQDLYNCFSGALIQADL